MLKSEKTSHEGTWITPEMIRAYVKLHELGFAHSVECYSGGKLVGGLYGVSIGRMFAGESMFHLESNTSKFCLLKLVECLQAQGAQWLDCQQLTPLFEQFGAREVAREEFLEMLKLALGGPALKFEFP